MSIVCNLTIKTFKRSFLKNILNTKKKTLIFTFSPKNWKYLHIYIFFLHFLQLSSIVWSICILITSNFYIRCTLFLFTPQLDNRQLRCWNITFYLMFEQRNCIGIHPIDSVIVLLPWVLQCPPYRVLFNLGVKWVLNTGLALAYSIIWLK